MSKLHVIARLSIHPGKLDAFKSVAAKCMKSVKEKDSGTLQYSWFLNDAGTECVVLETYKDSPAVFEHMGNLGDTLGELQESCDMVLEIYGAPSPELTEAARGMGATICGPFQGL